MFGICKLIDLVVPDIPETLDIKIKRERYLAKEALQEAEHVLQKVLTGDAGDEGDSDAAATGAGAESGAEDSPKQVRKRKNV